MYTIENNIETELIIKNSKFICILSKIENVDEVNKLLNKAKTDYPSANHYCYAFVTENAKKSNDDGEPSGTAGTPILKVLEAQNLTNILVIIVRYFGGIKLGANGLIRAYTKSVSKAIQEAQLKLVKKGYNVTITFEYEKIKNIDYLLKDVKINKKEFDKLVTYNIDIPYEFIEKIKEYELSYTIIKEIYI